MKLSAYVPDRLWSRVTARYPRSGPSRLVQLGLRRLVERSRPRFAEIAGVDRADESVALAQGGTRLTRLRQEAYDEGYEAGLALGETLGWADLEKLASVSWRLDGLATGGDPTHTTVAHLSGLRDALRDAWLGVVGA
jgi:hypothetical protein